MLLAVWLAIRYLLLMMCRSGATGRIYQNNGLYVVTLAIDPDTVDMTLDYQFQYRSINDNLHGRKVSSIDVVGRMVSVTVKLVLMYLIHRRCMIFCSWAGRTYVQAFIVTSISRNGEYQRQITALEYNAPSSTRITRSRCRTIHWIQITMLKTLSIFRLGRLLIKISRNVMPQDVCFMATSGRS